MTPKKAALSIVDLSFSYDNNLILKNLNLELEAQEIACLLGPSGCGKSTLLRCISGFEQIKQGQIFINNRIVSSASLSIPPEDRNVGFVFQDCVLFPHLNLEENIAFGLHKLSRAEKEKRVDELLDIIQLKPLRKARAQEISGGQQQRAALARALAPRPDLLLMDEPFSHLDPELREEMKREVRNILKELKATAIIVTHDQNEAFDTGDLIAVMGEGKIHQCDAAYSLYHKPRNRFVADFVGQGVFLPGEVVNDKDLSIHTEFGTLKAQTQKDYSFREQQKVCVLLRPEDVVHDDESQTKAHVLSRAFRGTYNLFSLRLKSGSEVLCMAPSHHTHPVGSEIGIRLELDHVIAFPAKETDDCC